MKKILALIFLLLLFFSLTAQNTNLLVIKKINELLPSFLIKHTNADLRKQNLELENIEFYKVKKVFRVATLVQNADSKLPNEKNNYEILTGEKIIAAIFYETQFCSAISTTENNKSIKINNFEAVEGWEELMKFETDEYRTFDKTVLTVEQLNANFLILSNAKAEDEKYIFALRNARFTIPTFKNSENKLFDYFAAYKLIIEELRKK